MPCPREPAESHYPAATPPRLCSVECSAERSSRTHIAALPVRMGHVDENSRAWAIAWQSIDLPGSVARIQVEKHTRLGAPNVSALICVSHENAWFETLGAYVCSLNSVECVCMNGMLVLVQLWTPWQPILDSGSPMECTVALIEQSGGEYLWARGSGLALQTRINMSFVLKMYYVLEEDEKVYCKADAGIVFMPHPGRAPSY